jgi:HAD superfamily hydrolase (TIGR01544 family)
MPDTYMNLNSAYYLPVWSHSNREKLHIQAQQFLSDKDNFFVVADFDKTFTTWDWATSWYMLAKSGLVGRDYEEKRKQLYEYYRPFELNNQLSFEERNEKMNEWRFKHLSLLIEYKVQREQITNVTKEYMEFREWVKEFFANAKQHNIPIIIVSAWIGNFIEEFLQFQGIDMSNVAIESNFLLYDEHGNVIGMDKTHIIQPLNKNQHILTQKSLNLVWIRKNALVLWDGTGDLRMIDLFDVESYISIWLLNSETSPEYFDNSWFDIVSTNPDFSFINQIIRTQ